jgi:hypothetical protein
VTISARLRHVHARRKALRRDLDIAGQFGTWEETCVPSYCHRNLAAAYVSWWRLFAAVDLARRHARWDAVLDFGAAVGELIPLLPRNVGRYDFIEHNETAAAYLMRRAPDARRRTLASAPAGAYSCVFALDVLEHDRDYPALLRTLAQTLDPGGVMVISGPTENGFYRLGRRIAGFGGHYHQTTIYEIEAAAGRVMKCLDTRSLPPVAALFRLSAWRTAAGESGATGML